MKLNKLLDKLIADEDIVRCFICVRLLRPLEWKSKIKRLFGFILPEQYSVGIIRPLDEDGEAGLVSLFEITTCLKCGLWVQNHPLEGEILAQARLNSITKHGE